MTDTAISSSLITEGPVDVMTVSVGTITLSILESSDFLGAGGQGFNQEKKSLDDNKMQITTPLWHFYT